MGKPLIGFNKWPFPKGEKVKLIKIGKPYSDQGVWYVSAMYFSETSKQVKRIKHNFGDLHLLVCGADYIDGTRQEIPGWKTVDVRILKQSICDRQPKPYLNKDKYNQAEFEYYTFGFYYSGYYYVIPHNELLRAGLAPDVFWLNQVTSLDSIDTRILYETDLHNLYMSFLSDVPFKYVELDGKIKHAAWVFSNPEIYEMISQTYHNIQNGEGIKFDFLFDDLCFKAKVETKGNRIYVKEIVSFREKKINCVNIFVEHPGLVEYEKDSIEKEKKWIPVEKVSGDKTLVSDKTSTPNILDIYRYDSVQSEYSTPVIINRVRKKRDGGVNVSPRSIPIEVKGKGERTTADFGGLDTVPQLEFENTVDEKSERLFSDVLAILRSIENREEVESVGYHIGELNNYMRFRSICTLDDATTVRHFLVGKIKLYYGREALLIEIERENMALSTLMLVSDVRQSWENICRKVIMGLIGRSGSWPDIISLDVDNVRVYRFKHTNADDVKKGKRVFGSIHVIGGK